MQSEATKSLTSPSMLVASVTKDRFFTQTMSGRLPQAVGVSGALELLDVATRSDVFDSVKGKGFTARIEGGEALEATGFHHDIRQERKGRRWQEARKEEKAASKLGFLAMAMAIYIED